MATTTQNPLEAAIGKLMVSTAPKAVPAPRPTRAELVAKPTAGAVEQVATYTDINGVVREQRAPVLVYGAEPLPFLMAAE